jgi:hypothetical protein
MNSIYSAAILTKAPMQEAGGRGRKGELSRLNRIVPLFIPLFAAHRSSAPTSCPTFPPFLATENFLSHGSRRGDSVTVNLNLSVHFVSFGSMECGSTAGSGYTTRLRPGLIETDRSTCSTRVTKLGVGTLTGDQIRGCGAGRSLNALFSDETSVY